MILLVDTNWEKVLNIIRSEISPTNFRAWFKKSQGSLQSDGKLLVKVSTAFVKSTITSKHLGQLQAVVDQIYQKPTPIEVLVDQTIGHSIDQDEELLDGLELTQTQPNFSQAGLNPKYTLANFVVGLSNNLAFAAAQAVVQNPGKSYNPLFVYGGTGVGKTHLMLGIGNALLGKNPALKVLYCSSERFMNDFIMSIQNKRTAEFRQKYRLVDLLLIDDIQFISGRDSTQEEFFHTFNELQAKNAQVVLTSDRPPGEIQKLEGRLASRFQGGLMVDIQLPDFDTRVAILRAKSQEAGEQVPEEIITMIAENMETNARELEGKFIQIVQTAKLTKQVLSPDYLRKFLGRPEPAAQILDYKKVIAEVNRYFNIKMADITGPRRKKELVLPRQLAMFLLYEDCKIPYERIGEVLGGRDHTTILHGVEKIRQAVSRDREVQRLILEIKKNLGA